MEDEYVKNQLFVTYKQTTQEQEGALCDEFKSVGYDVHVFKSLYKGNKFLALFAKQENLQFKSASDLELLANEAVESFENKELVLGIYKVGIESLNPPDPDEP